ncbi:MAG: enoyl-CoA hydratase/isomerase family protein [Acidimicrobiales bacterium]
MPIIDLGLVTEAAGIELVESVSVLHSAEPVVIEPRGALDDGSLAWAVRVLRRLPAPTVLVGEPDLPTELVESVDVCLTSVSDPPRPWACAGVDEMFAVVDRQPLAALSLVVLLRNTGQLSTWSAVAEESATYAMLLGSSSFHEWLTSRGPGHHKTAERPPVHAERHGDVLRLTLDRPEVRNAIDSATRDALVEFLTVADVDPGLSVEIRGNGPCFSAGGDREEFGAVRDPSVAHAVRLTRHPGLALDSVASRTTCFVHGQCVGAGVEIPAFAGNVIADPTSTFSLPEVAMGLVPGAGGTVSIPRRVGRQRAAWLALTGSVIDTKTALEWGLVDRIG